MLRVEGSRVVEGSETKGKMDDERQIPLEGR